MKKIIKIILLFTLTFLLSAGKAFANKKIKITPHIASVTNAEAGAKQIINNYYANLEGRTLINEVDLKKGY